MTTALPILSEILDPLAIELERGALLRQLGYRGSAATKRRPPEPVEDELLRGQPLLEPKGLYAVYPIEQLNAKQFTLGGVRISGPIAGFVSGADRIAVFIVTVGVGITQAAHRAKSDGDMLAAWTLDVLGSCAAEAAADAVTARLRERFTASGTVSQRFSPGYCGMQLASQTALFSLVQAEAIGVRLEPSMLMQPIKSVSGILGIGGAGIFHKGSSPCDRCRDLDCVMRR